MGRGAGEDGQGDDVAEGEIGRFGLADGGVRELIGRLPDWEDPGPLSGHESPAFAPNILTLLADMGTGEQDDGRIAVILDAMRRMARRRRRRRCALPGIGGDSAGCATEYRQLRWGQSSQLEVEGATPSGPRKGPFPF